MSKTGYWLLVFACIGAHMYQCNKETLSEEQGMETTMPNIDSMGIPKPQDYQSFRPFYDKEADSLEKLYNPDSQEYQHGEGQWDDDDSWTGYFAD